MALDNCLPPKYLFNIPATYNKISKLCKEVIGVRFNEKRG